MIPAADILRAMRRLLARPFRYIGEKRRHKRSRDLIAASGLFDEQYYLSRVPDSPPEGEDALDHFIRRGGRQGWSPSRDFDAFWYLCSNRDVAVSRVNPLLHYLRHGQEEGRRPLCDGVPAIELRSPSVAAKEPAVFSPEERSSVLKRLKQKPPRVSVIMPTWNRSHVVTRAVGSALVQSWPPDEIIIVDDGSEDGTSDAIRTGFADELNDGRLKLLHLQHTGVSVARNTALDVAEGDHVAFLDSDNIWHPDHLLLALNELHENAETDAVYTAVRKRNLTEENTEILCRAFDRGALLFGNFVDLNSLIHKRNAETETVRFDPNLTRFVDWDYIIRLTQRRPARLVPYVTVEYFLDESGLENITYTEDPFGNTSYIRDKHYAELRSLFEKPVAETGRRGEATEENPLSDYSLIIVVDDLSDIEACRSVLEAGFDFNTCFLCPDAAFSHFTVTDLNGAERVSFDGEDALPDGAYWYPDPEAGLPSCDQVSAAFLSMWINRLNAAFISHSLKRDGTVATGSVRNQCLVGRTQIRSWHGNGKLTGDIRGRILHMPPGPANLQARSVSIASLTEVSVSVDPETGVVRGAGNAPPAGVEALPPLDPPFYRKSRPTVLVFAMKLAVGGVERNTIEIFRQLRGEYDFIYLTTEKTTEDRGTLASQAREVSHRLIDMTEICDHHHYIELLERIRDLYAPDLVWICNGSFWLVQNAVRLRSVFSDIPIIDQQAYDAKEGWIEHYDEPGIQSFDRFVCVNTAIRRKMIEGLSMDPSRIDLIYSAFDTKKLSGYDGKERDAVRLRDKFGLPAGKKVFVFMARLAEQKRPLDFLKLARLRASHEDEHFLLVGNGDLAGAVSRWLRWRGGHNVHWIPYVEHVEELWAVSDGIVITSIYEGLPIAMLEAIAMGVPVLSTDVGEIRPVVEEFGAGMIVEKARDPRGMCRAFDVWKAGLGTYSENLSCNRDTILKRFSSETAGEAYKVCWSKAIAGRAAARDGS